MENKVQNYVSITKLSKERQPEVFEKEGKGYFYTHHGAQACVIYNGDAMCYLGYVELAPMRSRGNHFHNKKHENICVISGKIKAKFVLPDNCDDIYETELEQGDIVHINPGCAHSFFSQTGASLIEYSAEKYEIKDTIRYSFYWNDEIL